MAELINMPKLGFDMQEGQLVGWLKQAGDSITEGDVIAEIESDKATIEVEVFQQGTLLELLASEGDWVPVGAPIAIVGEAGEDFDKSALGLETEAPVASENGSSEQATVQEKKVPMPVTTNGTSAASASEAGLPGGVKASPLARRIAQDLDVDLQQVSGSGPNGRIVREDVERFKEEMGDMPAVPQAAPSALAPTPAMSVTIGPDDEVIDAGRLRQRIAQRMTQSKTTIPHFYVTMDIDMAPAVALRKDINARLEGQGVKVSVNDMIIKAAALALKAYPNLNATYNGDTIVRRGHINVGIAVAIEGGLMNVVSKDADSTPLSQMAPNHKDMIARAREGKVKPEDLDGETFAVSNLGPYGVEHFTAIINPPSAAIIAVGTARKIPVVTEDDRIAVGIRMMATLSADHRVTDGAEAAEFMRTFKEILEDPMRLLL